jgi:hypothetical protein
VPFIATPALFLIGMTVPLAAVVPVYGRLENRAGVMAHHAGISDGNHEHAVYTAFRERPASGTR